MDSDVHSRLYAGKFTTTEIPKGSTLWQGGGTAFPTKVMDSDYTNPPLPAILFFSVLAASCEIYIFFEVRINVFGSS